LVVSLAAARTTVLVPLDRIELDPENIRSAYGEEHIANLRDALRAALVIGEEYINPPEIYPIGPEKYRVKHGNCRILAATGVVDSLHVFICELPASTAGKIVEQLSENLLQGGLNPLDTGRALRRLRDLESMSIGAIVSRLREQGLSKGRFWVTMRIGLTELHPKVQDMVAHGRIAPRGAWALRAMPPSEQVEWAERIWNGRWSFQTLTKELRAVGWLPKDFDEKLEERGGGFREPDGSAADHGYMVPASPMGPVEWQQARLGEDIRLAATGTGPDGAGWSSWRYRTCSPTHPSGCRTKWPTRARCWISRTPSDSWPRRSTPSGERIRKHPLRSRKTA
jgi:hypothetical protein